MGTHSHVKQHNCCPSVTLPPDRVLICQSQPFPLIHPPSLPFPNFPIHPLFSLSLSQSFFLTHWLYIDAHTHTQDNHSTHPPSLALCCPRHQLDYLCYLLTVCEHLLCIPPLLSSSLSLSPPSFSSPALGSHPSPSSRSSLCVSVFMDVRMRVRWPDGTVCRCCKVNGRMVRAHSFTRDSAPSLFLSFFLSFSVLLIPPSLSLSLFW